MRVTSDDVQAFLRDRGFSGVHAIERIGHGEWSTAFSFAVVDRTGEYVVRFSAVDEDFRKDQHAVRYATPALPVPPLLDVGPAFDGFYAIAERVPGQFLDDLDAEHMRQVLPSLWAALTAMRDADVSATHGYGPWDRRGDAPFGSWADALLAMGMDRPESRIAGWRSALEQSPTGAEPFDQAFGRLRALAGDLPNERHVVHSDLLNYNVLVRGERLTAVLDWGSEMYGDWLFDLAWFSFWQPWFPAWAAIDFEAEARRYFDTIDDFDLRVQCSKIAIGLDNQAYCAFKGEARWEQLAAVAERTLSVSS